MTALSPVIRVLKKCRVLIGIAIFVFIIFRLDIWNFFSLLPQCRLKPLFAAYLASLGIVILMTFRWYLILRFIEVPYGFVQAGISLIKGLFLGEITPGRLGELLRAVYVANHTGKPMGIAVFSVVLDRLYDIFTLCFLGAIGAILITNFFILNMDVPWILIMSFIVLFAAGAVLITQEKLAAPVVKPVFNILIPEKHRQRTNIQFDAFFKGYRNITFRHHVYCLGCSCIIWIIKFALLFLLALALNIDIPFLFAVSLGALAVLVSMIPISISGLGTREALFIYLLGAFDVEAAAAVMLSLFYVIIPFLGILLYFLVLKATGRQNTV